MNSTFANETNGEKKHLFCPAATLALNATYLVISVAAIVCNILVVMLFFKDKRMRRPFYILLFNISLSDLLSAISIQPYIWIDFTEIRHTGSAAPFLCAISVGLILLMACSVANVITLCTVTVLRYLSIVKNYRGHILESKRFSIVLCVLAWLIGALTRIPGALSFTYNYKEAVCYRVWPTHINGSLYAIMTSLVFLFFPFVLMTSIYISLILHIWKRSRSVNGSNLIALRARKSVAMLLGFLVLANVLCWTPFSLVWVMGRSFNYFEDSVEGEYERQRWLRIAMIFVLFNNALDPFIYAFSSREYRGRFLRMIPRAKGWHSEVR